MKISISAVNATSYQLRKSIFRTTKNNHTGSNLSENSRSKILRELNKIFQTNGTKVAIIANAWPAQLQMKNLLHVK